LFIALELDSPTSRMLPTAGHTVAVELQFSLNSIGKHCTEDLGG